MKSAVIYARVSSKDQERITLRETNPFHPSESS
jgi:hypothetical protein